MRRPTLLVAAIALLAGTVVPCAAQVAPVWTIGGEDGVGTELGSKALVIRLPEHLLILERDAPFLKLATLDGRLRQQVGRFGGGPGEFRRPTAAFLDSTRRELFVVDGVALRVSVYAVGDSLSFSRALVAPEPGLEGICRLRGRWFGLVRNSSTMLRELTVEKDRLAVKRSFAEPKSLHPLAAIPALRNEASGSLTCDDRRGELIVVSHTLGEVHRIDADGRRHSVHAIPGFTVMPFGTKDGMLFAEIRQGEANDVVTDVVTVTSDVLVVVARATATPQGRRIDGYFVHAVGDQSASGPPALDRWAFVGEVTAGSLCMREDPAPMLALFTGRRCPPR
jgi:hypothetical protein